eukprot:COSAG06_NODE_8363_length_2189_cov_48.041070_2_plen_93_part_00
MLHLRVLVQERRCLLQVERPDRGQRVQARGNKTMDATKQEVAGAEEYRNEKRVQLPPAASPPLPCPSAPRCLWPSSVRISTTSIATCVLGDS